MYVKSHHQYLTYWTSRQVYYRNGRYELLKVENLGKTGQPLKFSKHLEGQPPPLSPPNEKKENWYVIIFTCIGQFPKVPVKVV